MNLLIYQSINLLISYSISPQSRGQPTFENRPRKSKADPTPHPSPRDLWPDAFQAHQQLRREELTIDNRYTIKNADLHRSSNREAMDWNAKLWIDNRYTINNSELQTGGDQGITTGSALLLLVNLGCHFAIDQSTNQLIY